MQNNKESMAKDLTTSQLDRQNILNNTMALPRIQEELGVRALEFEGRYPAAIQEENYRKNLTIIYSMSYNQVVTKHSPSCH